MHRCYGIVPKCFTRDTFIYHKINEYVPDLKYSDMIKNYLETFISTNVIYASFSFLMLRIISKIDDELLEKDEKR